MYMELPKKNYYLYHQFLEASITVQEEDHRLIYFDYFVECIKNHHRQATCLQKSSEYLQLQNKCLRVSDSRFQKEHCGEMSSLNLLRKTLHVQYFKMNFLILK